MSDPQPIHSGEHLAEIMQELGITQYRLAMTMGCRRACARHRKSGSVDHRGYCAAHGTHSRNYA